MASRPRAWADSRIVATLTTAADILVDLLAGAPTVDTLTAIRIVVNLNCHYIVTNTLSDSDSVVDIGIGVTSVEAFAAGATSVPDPSSPTSFPPRGWLYVDTGYVGQALTSATGVFNENAVFKVDLRAARKIDKGTLFLRIANTNINVGGAMEVVGRVRVLCLG